MRVQSPRRPAHSWLRSPRVRLAVKRASLVAIGAVLGALVLPAPAPAAIPHLPWTSCCRRCPARATSSRARSRHCRRPRVACVDGVIKRLRRLRNRLGCDHRGVFATTYLELTKQIRQDLDDYPDLYRDRRYLYFQDALFANVYVDTFRAYKRGEPVAASLADRVRDRRLERRQRRPGHAPRDQRPRPERHALRRRRARPPRARRRPRESPTTTPATRSSTVATSASSTRSRPATTRSSAGPTAT